MLRKTVESIHHMAISECVCMTVENIHQMAISVCVCMAICYLVTYDSEEYSPVGNISIYLHYEKLPRYIWQWREFTCWQHLYVSALRTVTILRITVKIFHLMAISVFVLITNSYHITYDSKVYSSEATSVCVCIRNSYHVTYYSEEYSPDGNINMYLHYEMLPWYVWQWRVFTRWQHQYVSV